MNEVFTPMTDETRDAIAFYHGAYCHAIDNMTTDESIKNCADILADLEGCDKNSKLYFMIVGILAGIEEGLHIAMTIDELSEKETATPTDESKDCR